MCGQMCGLWHSTSVYSSCIWSFGVPSLWSIVFAPSLSPTHVQRSRRRGHKRVLANMQQYWKTFSGSPGWGTRGIASMGLEAYVLGVTGGLCLGLTFSVAAYRPFLVFVCLLSVFHITEWMFAAVYHT